jgi:hypothetical protein
LLFVTDEFVKNNVFVNGQKIVHPRATQEGQEVTQNRDEDKRTVKLLLLLLVLENDWKSIGKRLEVIYPQSSCGTSSKAHTHTENQISFTRNLCSM